MNTETVEALKRFKEHLETTCVVSKHDIVSFESLYGNAITEVYPVGHYTNQPTSIMVKETIDHIGSVIDPLLNTETISEEDYKRYARSIIFALNDIKRTIIETRKCGDDLGKFFDHLFSNKGLVDLEMIEGLSEYGFKRLYDMPLRTVIKDSWKYQSIFFPAIDAYYKDGYKVAEKERFVNLKREVDLELEITQASEIKLSMIAIIFVEMSGIEKSIDDISFKRFIDIVYGRDEIDIIDRITRAIELKENEYMEAIVNFDHYVDSTIVHTAKKTYERLLADKISRTVLSLFGKTL